MEKVKYIFFRLIFVTAAAFCLAQTPSQKEQLRIQVWADLDPFPGQFETSENETSLAQEEAPAKKSEESDFDKMFGFAINRTKQIAPYLISGMLNGWEFEYTPYDKRRKVDEYWEFIQILEFNPQINKLEYKAPQVLDDRLVVWVYCDRNEAQKQLYNQWTSITYPHVKGKGKGPVEDGFEGIKKACSEAAKDAVREYWRTMIKNKPKEISGKLLLIREPRVYIKDGQYVVDLDFFLETDKISQYKYY